MIVYLARDIPAFVMYCVNGESGSSLLIESTYSMIESTDSMIIIIKYVLWVVCLYAGMLRMWSFALVLEFHTSLILHNASCPGQ